MKILPVIHIFNTKQAHEQAELLVTSGCDGFWLINHGGDDELTLSLAAELSFVYKDHMVGVNLLSHLPLSAINQTIKSGIKYLWLDYAGVHSIFPDELLLKQLAEKSKKYNVQIFAGTAFKYQRHEPNPMEASQLAQSYGFTVTTSGAGTGHAADLNKIKLMSKAISGKLGIASGLTIDNLPEYHPYIEYALIATGISKDEHHFDVEKLKLFVNKSKKLNSHLIS
jgi:predicted TIM-barrel enzyme